MLQKIADSHLPVLVYETDMKAGGLGESIIAWFVDHDLDVHIEQMGIGDVYVPQGAETRLRHDLGIDLNAFLDRLNKLL